MNKQKKGAILILTGEVHSGKSTALLKWVDGKSVSGFITPTISGKKVLFNVISGEISLYELLEPNEASIKIGDYFLEKNAFTEANNIIRNAITQPTEWMVIDEIGKLELNGEGHHKIFTELLANWKRNMLIVVRESLLNDFIEKYQITNPYIVTKLLLENYK